MNVHKFFRMVFSFKPLIFTNARIVNLRNHPDGSKSEATCLLPLAPTGGDLKVRVNQCSFVVKNGSSQSTFNEMAMFFLTSNSHYL